MKRKEEIVRAMLDLAAERGLGAVTLSQVAKRVGMRTPSLYNHFASKEELVQEAYRFLREQARGRNVASDVDLGDLVADKSLEEVLLLSFDSYRTFVLDDELLSLWRVLYAERTTSPVAAQIVLEETEHMVRQARGLFYALAAHGMLAADGVDMAALSYAMTIHGLVDLQLDRLTASGRRLFGEEATFGEAKAYISWFARQMGEAHA